MLSGAGFIALFQFFAGKHPSTYFNQLEGGEIDPAEIQRLAKLELEAEGSGDRVCLLTMEYYFTYFARFLAD